MNQILNDLKLNANTGPGIQNGASTDKTPTSTQPRPTTSSPSNGDHILNMVHEPVIRDVWEDNLEEEFKAIMNLIEKYNIIGMDTEFPGIVYRPTEVINYSELEYKTIKANVDELKVIQVGISLASEDGYLPEGVTTWQFNFQFDLQLDKHANDAIDLLSNSGIKFDQHRKMGISPLLFAEYMISSGLALNDDIKWISFHGGFDFAYLIKMLNGSHLPGSDSEFYKLVNTYFPQYFDIKYMVKDIDALKAGGLARLANEVNVKRIGPQHQAGSDSLLTLQTYFKLKETYLKNVPDKKYNNVLHGIGGEYDDLLPGYLWDNIGMVAQDNYYNMMNYGWNVGLNPIMNANYYPQNDPYNGMQNGFNMNFNPIYNNFNQPMNYLDNAQGKKKMDMFVNKVKS